MRKVAIIICNGSGASVKWGPKDGQDGIRLTHIVDRLMHSYGFPPDGDKEVRWETKWSYWPSSLIGVKRAVRRAIRQGCNKFVFIGFSKGAMRIFDGANWMQRKADRGNSAFRTVLQHTDLVMIDYQRTIFNKHNARPRILKAVTARVTYVRQEGSKANPKVKRCMNGYPMKLPQGMGNERVITERGVWHNNIRHQPIVHQFIANTLKWAFGREEI